MSVSKVLSSLWVKAAGMTDDVRQICSCLRASANFYLIVHTYKKQETFQGRGTAAHLWKRCGILISSKMSPKILLLLHGHDQSSMTSRCA